MKITRLSWHIENIQALAGFAAMYYEDRAPRIRAWAHRVFGLPKASELPPLPHDLDTPPVREAISELTKHKGLGDDTN